MLYVTCYAVPLFIYTITITECVVSQELVSAMTMGAAGYEEQPGWGALLLAFVMY